MLTHYLNCSLILENQLKNSFNGIITNAEYGATLGEVQIINISFITSGTITSAI